MPKRTAHSFGAFLQRMSSGRSFVPSPSPSLSSRSSGMPFSSSTGVRNPTRTSDCPIRRGRPAHLGPVLILSSLALDPFHPFAPTDQMYLDDLPVWGMVGESYEDEAGEKKVFIYTHQKFSLSWNSDRVRTHDTDDRSPPLLPPPPPPLTNSLFICLVFVGYRGQPHLGEPCCT
jgi:hypothetical protein